jgi:hypothetical protein
MNPSLSIHTYPRPRVKGLVTFLVLVGLLGLLGTRNLLAGYMEASLLPLQIWPIFIHGALSLITLVSAVLVYRYKRSGLILGLIGLSYLLSHIMWPFASVLYAAVTDDATNSMLLFFPGLQIIMSVGCLAALSKYLLHSGERDYFI